jgi:hypothetical protein
MKILFLCGSAEPGKDGVGDYTRRVAGELIRQGHSCVIVAIMDKGIDSPSEELQESEFITIAILRLPFYNGYKKNCLEAKPWIDDFKPDWISLQYVPFSFNPKGLPFGFGKTIRQLSKGYKFHIMFHELWVGMNREATLKLKIWGITQRTMIRSFVKSVKPSLIHTQSKLYQWQLSKLGMDASLLPLISNIKVFCDNLKTNNSNVLRFVLFGSIHSGSPIASFGDSIVEYSTKSGKVIEIIFIGRCGLEQKKWISVFKSKKIRVKVLGEQSIQKISETLSNADLGITTTPILLTEKSGTVAAMIAHRLPILCVSKLWKVVGFSGNYTPSGIQFFQNRNLDKYLVLKKANLISNTISSISKQFSNSLLNIR